MNDKRGREGKKVKEKEEKKRRELKNSNGKHKQDVCMAVQHPQKKRRRRERDGRKESQKSGAHVRTFARSHGRVGEAPYSWSHVWHFLLKLCSENFNLFICLHLCLLHPHCPPCEVHGNNHGSKCEKSTHKCIMRIVSTIMINRILKNIYASLAFRIYGAVRWEESLQLYSIWQLWTAVGDSGRVAHATIVAPPAFKRFNVPNVHGALSYPF